MLRVVIIGGLMLLALLTATLVWRLQPGQALAVAPGDEIRYGSFGLTINGMRRVPSIGDGSTAVVAQGEFVIVSLGLHNRSESGELSFPPSAARLIDGDGNVSIPNEAGTAALAAATADGLRCTGPIRAGDSCSVELPFDLPPGTSAARLAMQFEGPIFEFVEMLIHGRRWLVLPE